MLNKEDTKDVAGAYGKAIAKKVKNATDDSKNMYSLKGKSKSEKAAYMNKHKDGKDWWSGNSKNK